jgi:hypothetical protein
MEIDQEIWLDRIAEKLQFDWLAEKYVPFTISPAMLFVATMIFVDTILFELYSYLIQGNISFIDNPFVLLGEGGGGLLIAIYAVHRLNREYENALTRLQIDKREDIKPDQFRTLAFRLNKYETDAGETRWKYRIDTDQMRWAGFALGASLQIIQISVFVGPARLYEVGGIVGLLGNYFFIPFVYVPVAVEFAVTYFSVQVLLPLNLKNSELSLDFLDPEKMGGLRPIGELLKHSYYYFIMLYISFALFMYGPELFPELFYSPFNPGPVVNILFTVGWIISAGMLAFGIYIIHLFMSREKREELRRLDDKVKEKVEQPFDAQNFRVPHNDEDYEQIRTRMEYVTSTREYPATFTFWSQLLISILIPKAVQMVLNLA